MECHVYVAQPELEQLLWWSVAAAKQSAPAMAVIKALDLLKTFRDPMLPEHHKEDEGNETSRTVVVRSRSKFNSTVVPVECTF